MRGLARFMWRNESDEQAAPRCEQVVFCARFAKIVAVWLEMLNICFVDDSLKSRLLAICKFPIEAPHFNCQSLSGKSGCHLARSQAFKSLSFKGRTWRGHGVEAR